MDLNNLNPFGVPLHACNGYRHDEHWWAWMRHRILRGDFGTAVQRRLRASVAAGLVLTMSGCGFVDRAGAYATGFSRQCIDGVEYLQFASGATVAYTADGKVKRCGPGAGGQ